MAIHGRMLLQRLEPAVRPAAAPFPGVGVAPLEDQDFAALLAAAKEGKIESGRTPDVTRLREALPPESSARMAKALDILEASGARSAVMLYGSRMLIADVASRTIEGELLAHEGPMPTPVDAAVRIPTPDEDLPTRRPGPPAALNAPAGLIELLEARDSQA